MEQIHRRVDIVVPVYNERENFLTLWKLLHEQMHSDWHLYVVYDFPEDTTLEVATPLVAQDSRLHVVQNTGKGVLGAIVTGLRAAKADAVMVLMVDEGEESFPVLDRMVDTFYETGAGVVVASRYMKGGHSYGSPFLKSLLSRLAGVSLYYVVGLPTHDATNATRLYKRAFLEKTPIESTQGFVLTIELTVKAYFAGERIEELPVTWRERIVGKSRFKLRKWLPAYLHWYFYALKRYWLPFMYGPAKNTQLSS